MVRVAGEAEALRRTYNVPDSEPAVLPARMVHEASQRVNNARLAAEGAPMQVQSAVKVRAAKAVLGVLEQVKRVGKAARLLERAKKRSGEVPVQAQVSGKEKMMSETEERLRREREARAERARQMVERTRSLDDRLRNQPDDQAAKQQRMAQQQRQRQMQERQAQQMHEQARRGVRGPGVS